MKTIKLDDTIVAVSTPVGEGGIGIVRMSGKKALPIADKIFLSKNGSKPSEFETYTTHYGHIIDRHASCPAYRQAGVMRHALPTGRQASKNKHKIQDTRHKTQIIDEVILTVMRAPRSYTKEDIVEINCHGGIVPLKKVLDLTVNLGARVAEPGEFTRRAFLNGRIDLAQAEAVLDVIRSKTDASLNAALNQLEGALSIQIRKLKNEIMDFYIHIEAAIDFPEEDIKIYNSIELSKKIDAALKRLKALIESSECGKVLREGVATVICGKPNVGKSTLMNAFLKENKVIVTPIPGTTRDVIEEVINIKGIPLRIADTAGIIEPSDLIEKEGVQRSRKYIRGADLILFILDNSQDLTDEDRVIMDMVKDKKAIIVVNKTDLPSKLDLEKAGDWLDGKKIVKISAMHETNIDILEKAISEMVWSGEIFSSHQALVTNVRHADALRRAYKSMGKAKDSLNKGLSPEFMAMDIKQSLDALGEIIGEAIMEDMLDKIFGEFCIGK